MFETGFAFSGCCQKSPMSALDDVVEVESLQVKLTSQVLHFSPRSFPLCTLPTNSGIAGLALVGAHLNAVNANHFLILTFGCMRLQWVGRCCRGWQWVGRCCRGWQRVGRCCMGWQLVGRCCRGWQWVDGRTNAKTKHPVYGDPSWNVKVQPSPHRWHQKQTVPR